MCATRATAQDATQGTIGWFAFATGTVGITKGQTLRLSVANLGASDTTVCMGSYMNPHPILLVEESFALEPGESKHIDLKASDVPREHFDKTARAQVRAFVRSSARTVRSHLEVFDDQTGRTNFVLPLQDFNHHE